MSKKIKKISFFLLFVFLLTFFYFRYLQLESGYSSNRWDFGAHISIISSIQDGNLFPEFQKAQASYHAIASWMPLYHGILGTHFLTLFISLFGLSIPAAMLLLSDLSLALIFYVFYRVSKRSLFQTILIYCAVILPGFVLMSYQGFFSMTIGSAIAFFGLYLHDRKKMTPALFVLLFSFVCYPDSSIWVLGYFFYFYFQKRKENPHYKYYAYGLLLLTVALLGVFITRGFLPGGASWPLTYIVLLLLLTAFSRWKNPFFFKNSTNQFMLIFIFVAVFTILIQMLLFRDLSVDYYPRKYTYWSIFFISLLLLRFSFPKGIWVLSAGLLIYGFILEKEDWTEGFQHFFLGSGAFTTRQENELLQLKKIPGCTSWIHIPYFLSKDRKVNIKDVVYDIIFYSKFNQYDVYRAEVQTDLVTKEEDRVINSFLGRIAYEDSSDKTVKDFIEKAQSLKSGHCFMVDKSRDPLFKDYLEYQIKQMQYSSIYKF